MSLGAGFVGVAGSVSVWTVGTQPTQTYDDAGSSKSPLDTGNGSSASQADSTASGSPEAWMSGGSYTKSSIVSYGGKNYAAKVDIVNKTLDPVTDSAEWGETRNGGYTSGLSGTSGADQGTWVSGHAYLKGDVVSYFDGAETKSYSAKADIVNTSLDPKSNSAEWNGEQSQLKTNSRINAVTGGASSQLPRAPRPHRPPPRSAAGLRRRGRPLSSTPTSPPPSVASTCGPRMISTSKVSPEPHRAASPPSASRSSS